MHFHYECTSAVVLSYMDTPLSIRFDNRFLEEATRWGKENWIPGGTSGAVRELAYRSMRSIKTKELLHIELLEIHKKIKFLEDEIKNLKSDPSS